MVGSDYCFTSANLLQYTESLIKEAHLQEMSLLPQSNYGWLKSRHVETSDSIGDLDKLKPLIKKMSPESCALIAVKLDSSELMTSKNILLKLKTLLEERDSIQMMSGNIRRGKEKKNNKRVNRVHPDLSTIGREETVSFIL
ncbi:hypothetical protein K1T71_014208 [Dendrolimus kikuchii]|uniref:Uncharacterized protein n=1 Tax=Dendrolimus kikuchii TaxID=765133 RepID=A0ACC1CF99_9NEOP|nr:hypothetical protein K1T71_014208 [Dendrolimus kikuchii]